MRDIADMVASLGGMAQKQQLVALGARDLDLTGSVRRGETRRARQGWYTTLPDSDPRVRAVRVGGRLTGISAVVALDGWVLERNVLHVSLHDNAARMRTPWNRHILIKGRRIHGLVLHWDDAAIGRRGSAVSVDLLDALVRVVIDEKFETAVAALDWALHFGLIDWMDFGEIINRLPKRLQKIQHWVDENCESLPESLARGASGRPGTRSCRRSGWAICSASTSSSRAASASRWTGGRTTSRRSRPTGPRTSTSPPRISTTSG